MGWTEEAGYDICLQDQGYSCGMACVAMIIATIDGQKLDERMLANESQRIGGAGKYEAAFADKVGHVPVFGPGSASKMTKTDQNKELGTYADNLGKILANYLIENECKWHKNASAMFGANGQDVIALLNWDNGGGGHFVVVRKTDGRLVVRDPYYGVSGQAISNDYKPNNSKAKGATGKFNGWIIAPTGKRLKAARVKVM